MQRLRVFSNGQRRLFSNWNDKDVVVCGFARTPIGRMNGGLASKTAPQLGAIAVSEAIKRSGINKDLIEEAFLGNVVSAGVGQAPARQAVLYAGLSNATVATTINKVCASGMKAAMFGALSISSGYRNVVIAGGMESMSNIPYYLPQARNGYRMGNGQVIDGMVHDGLWDVYGNQHMGMCGEDCATKYGITRKDQDDYAIRSYARAKAAWESGKFNEEVVPVLIEGKRGEKPTLIERDEEYTTLKLEKVPTLKSSFKKDGTITAANAPKTNDGASAMVIVSGKVAKDLNLKPLFKIRGFGDAERAPIEFTTAPSDAIPRALKHAGLQLSDIDYHEINEAFSVVALANAK